MLLIKHTKFGFTLIELLIVVAIIAILAAIAIPNFLAAQVRSKVSKVKNDFRVIATAVESYHIDNTSYPVYENGNNQSGVFGEDDAYNSNMMWIMTTPIAYITSWPKDQFSMNAFSGGIGVGYFLYTWNPEGSIPTPFRSFGYADNWATRSRGPNLIWDLTSGYTGTAPWTSQYYFGNDEGVRRFTYDPTNGTVSNGDMWRTHHSGQL